jgi:hypothetical protein
MEEKKTDLRDERQRIGRGGDWECFRFRDTITPSNLGAEGAWSRSLTSNNRGAWRKIKKERCREQREEQRLNVTLGLELEKNILFILVFFKY